MHNKQKKNLLKDNHTVNKNPIFDTTITQS